MDIEATRAAKQAFMLLTAQPNASIRSDAERIISDLGNQFGYEPNAVRMQAKQGAAFQQAISFDAVARAYALLVNGPDGCDDDPDDVVRTLGKALGYTEEDTSYKFYAPHDPKKLSSKTVSAVTVTDPDTGEPVDVEIRKLATGWVVGIDASYLSLRDQPPVRSPYGKADRLIDIPINENGMITDSPEMSAPDRLPPGVEATPGCLPPHIEAVPTTDKLRAYREYVDKVIEDHEEGKSIVPPASYEQWENSGGMREHATVVQMAITWHERECDVRHMYSKVCHVQLPLAAVNERGDTINRSHLCECCQAVLDYVSNENPKAFAVAVVFNGEIVAKRS